MRVKKFLFYLPAIAMMAFIAYGSLTPGEKAEALNFLNVEIPDKLIHGVFYFILTLSFLYPLFKKHLKFNRNLLFILAVVFLYGVVLEILQLYFIKDRTGEFYDVLANTGGILIAVFVFKFYLNQFKNKMPSL